MSTPNNLSEIKEKINEIEEKSADGDYIYRGEPSYYEEHPYGGKVSSGLWRQFKVKSEEEQFDIEIVDIDYVQDGILNTAENYARGTDAGFEMMAQLQHFGGKTNLIDFTTDYLRALFFACDYLPNESGRLILLQQTEETTAKYQIEEPLNPPNRVIAQKSIFVRPPKGYIELEEYDIIDIPKSLKQLMLDHLQKYHGIFAATMYNDLHGFIINQERHEKAYMEFYRGITYQQEGETEDEDPNEIGSS